MSQPQPEPLPAAPPDTPSAREPRPSSPGRPGGPPSLAAGVPHVSAAQHIQSAQDALVGKLDELLADLQADAEQRADPVERG